MYDIVARLFILVIFIGYAVLLVALAVWALNVKVRPKSHSTSRRL